MPEQTLHFQIDEYYLDLQDQGQTVDIMGIEETRKNPFPGLRPFRTGEAHLFFGREGQSEELITRLMDTHFLGVLGNSGSGKSSLVRAGMIPALHAGRKQHRVSDWKIVICRPGNSPLENLAAGLAGANTGTIDEQLVKPEVERLLPLLRESSFGLLEAEEVSGEYEKTLIIVDQFEELFRFGRDIPKGDAAHFVDLLLTAVLQEDSKVYVVITMRSEFLGECVRYRGLPEIINQGQYLVPRLTGENVRRAVNGPLGVVGVSIDQTLVNRLVREVGDNMDQLPLLQHALMRTHQHWQARNPRPQPDQIAHEDYDAVGGMDAALGLHADEQWKQLPAADRAIAKLLFQRLTDVSAGDRGGRRPTMMQEIYGVAEALRADRLAVNRVIEHFRKMDVSFFMPPPGAPLQDESMLDISHESLLRNWPQLKEWASEEATSARLYQRLQQACAEYRQDPNQGDISGALLQRLIEWRDEAPHNHYWAIRYHAEQKKETDLYEHQAQYDDNMAHLARCIAASESRVKAQEEALVKETRQKQRALYRNIIISVVATALVVTGFLLWKVQSSLSELQEKQTEIDRLNSKEFLREAKVYIDAGQHHFAVESLKKAMEADAENQEARDSLAVFEQKIK
jgi:hypothetical protein